MRGRVSDGSGCGAEYPHGGGHLGAGGVSCRAFQASAVGRGGSGPAADHPPPDDQICVGASYLSGKFRDE